MAVCSSCNDVSSHLVETRKEGSSADATLHRVDVQFMTNLTTYSLPYVNITNAEEKGSDKWASATVLTAATLTNPGMTVSFQDLDTMIAAVGIIKAESWNDSIISATECAWQFCTKLVSSKVENGVLQENISDVSSQRVLGSYMFGDDPFWYAYEEANHHGFCNYKNLSVSLLALVSLTSKAM